MAKVISPFKLRGSIGDLCFFENEYGPQVKGKGGPTEWQVKNLDRFANTRRNAAEWQRVTAACQLLRRTMGNLLLSVRSMRLSGRMNGLMLEVLRTDRVHDWGERVVSAGDLSVLSGFEFNRNLALEDVLPVNPAHCYSLEPGKVVVNIPAFRLRHKKGLPIEATHYRLVSCLLTVDFDKGKYIPDKQESALQQMGNKAGAAFEVAHLASSTPGPGSFWLMGLEFYKLVHQRPVLVRGGALRIMNAGTSTLPHLATPHTGARNVEEWMVSRTQNAVAQTSLGRHKDAAASLRQEGRALMALVDADGNRKGSGEVAAAGDDAAAILPEESGLQSRRHPESLALHDAQQGQGIGRNEKNFHNKEFKSERINGSKSCHAAVIAAWVQGQKEGAINAWMGGGDLVPDAGAG